MFSLLKNIHQVDNWLEKKEYDITLTLEIKKSLNSSQLSPEEPRSHDETRC